jgi:hypothetical protein
MTQPSNATMAPPVATQPSDQRSLVNSIASMFAEPIFPSCTVEAEVGYGASNSFQRNVGEEFFHSVKALWDSSTSWTRCDDEWRDMVSYKMGGSKDRITYIDDPHDVQCVNAPLDSSALWYCHSRAVNVRISMRRSTEVHPPAPGTRYTSLTIDKFKEYTRNSSTAPGITWIFRLTMRWQGKCLSEAYASSPSYQVNISMKRDQATEGYMPSTHASMQQSLAANMCGKVQDMLAAGRSGSPLHLFVL